MKNARRQVAAIARKPSTTMTAIAHRGNSEPGLVLWSEPGDEGAVLAVRDTERRDAEATEAAEEEDMEAMTESA